MTRMAPTLLLATACQTDAQPPKAFVTVSDDVSLSSPPSEPSSTPTQSSSPAPHFVDQDGDGFGENEDCDDTDESVFPGAPALACGRDWDCDGSEVAGAFVAGTHYLSLEHAVFEAGPNALIELCPGVHGVQPTQLAPEAGVTIDGVGLGVVVHHGFSAAHELTLKDFSWEPSGENLQFASGDLSLVRLVVRDAQAETLVSCMDCNLVVEDCRFESNQAEFLIHQHGVPGALLATSTSFEDNATSQAGVKSNAKARWISLGWHRNAGAGLLLDGLPSSLLGSSFTEGDAPYLSLLGSSLELHDSSLVNNPDAAIVIDEASTLVATNATFSGNTQDISWADGFYEATIPSFTCTPSAPPHCAP